MSELLQFPTIKNFDPEQTRVMGEAFDLVREYAKHNGRNDLGTAEARERIAHLIIEKASAGESDPQELADYAIGRLKA